MSRPRFIDRDALLDVAERCVAENGAAALSFGSLATAAGLSKGTVQTIFVTRDSLLEALIARWTAREEIRFASELRGEATAEARVRAHLNSTKQENTDVGRTVMTMLSALTADGNTSNIMQEWYQSRLGDLEAESEEAKRHRIAYLAAEGAFLVRNLIGVHISEARWSEIFQDLETFVDHKGETI